MRAGVLLTAAVLACAAPAWAKAPVIVEVYTSQGCGACAPASELVDDLAAREGLLPLTFPVDYWDYLGWKDTFARPEFSERQRRYAEKLEAPAVYTPQVVVAGRAHASAARPDAVEALIEDAAGTAMAAPSLSVDDDAVAVGAARGQIRAAEVWLIRYDPREQDVRVRRGENQGRTLTYRNVVRELRSLGEWKGRAARYDLPPLADDGLSSLVVLQAPDGGEILALQAL